MATIQQLQAKAINTGKSIDAKRFIRAKLEEMHGDDAKRITNDMIGDTLTKMPGNIGDDSHVADLLNVFAQVLNPSETDKHKAGLPAVVTATVTADISAMIDKTPQAKLAADIAAALPKDMLAEMDADYQAMVQGKQAPFHCLLWLLKTFGPEATSNQFKDTLKTWPIVDSQLDIKAGKTIEVEVVFTSRFKDDMPAKYQVLNKQTSKFVDYDFYNNVFDGSPSGIDVNNRISSIEKRIADLGGKNNVDLDLLKNLKSERSNKRKQLKDAMRAYQQIEAFNKIDRVVARPNLDKATGLFKKGEAPIAMYEEGDPSTYRQVDMSSFLSYRPEQATDFASLLKSKPEKKKRAPSGKTSASDVKSIPYPDTFEAFEIQWANCMQWLDKKANLATLFHNAGGGKNKPLRDSLIEGHIALQPFYDREYKNWQADQLNPQRDVA